MSKTNMNPAEKAKECSVDANKQKAPTPYPPVDPAVAERNPKKSER